MPDITLIKIPESPAEFVPPKVASLTAEMKSLLRDPDHYAEILPYLKAIAGETKSINGSAKYDEAGCVFAIKDMCQHNGYTLLAKLNPAQISRVFKTAYKGNTGHSVGKLIKQGSQLRIEYKQIEDNKPVKGEGFSAEAPNEGE